MTLATCTTNTGHFKMSRDEPAQSPRGLKVTPIEHNWAPIENFIHSKNKPLCEFKNPPVGWARSFEFSSKYQGTGTKLVLTWPKPTWTNCGKTTPQLNCVLQTDSTSARNQVSVGLQATGQNLQRLEFSSTTLALGSWFQCVNSTAIWHHGDFHQLLKRLPSSRSFVPKLSKGKRAP